MRSKFSITIDEATAGLRAAVVAARSKAVSVAVTDETGVLLSFERMDGARPHTVELALQKARTSAMVGVPSAAIQAAGHRDISAGGIPVMSHGACVGAIGVSGAEADEDVRIALAGVAAVLVASD